MQYDHIKHQVTVLVLLGLVLAIPTATATGAALTLRSPMLLEADGGKFLSS